MRCKSLIPHCALTVALFGVPAAHSQSTPPSEQSQAAGEELSSGVTAFKAGQYKVASQHFEAAVRLDPTSSTARLYLGTAYSLQVVPNVKTPDNLALAEKAIDSFAQIPEANPDFYDALAQTAFIYFNVDRLDEALTAQRHLLALRPDNADTHYTIGVIEWRKAYGFAVHALAAEGLKEDGLGNTKMTSATCDAIRSNNQQLVDDAIQELGKAVELNPGYADAMVYLNLSYRRKADFACRDTAARNQALQQADDWTKRATAARAQKEAGLLSGQPSASPQ